MVGWVVRVDAGTYNLSANLVITPSDSGVKIEGYHDAGFASRHATINRGLTSSGNYTFELQNADNVLPILRTPKLNNEIKDLWNSISAKLTTSDLVAMNKKADVDKQDPDALAEQWLRDHGFSV